MSYTFREARWSASTPPAMSCGGRNARRPERPPGLAHSGSTNTAGADRRARVRTADVKRRSSSARLIRAMAGSQSAQHGEREGDAERDDADHEAAPGLRASVIRCAHGKRTACQSDLLRVPEGDSATGDPLSTRTGECPR